MSDSARQTAVQPNGVDCGPYVHHHLDTVFQTGNPRKILEHFTVRACLAVPFLASRCLLQPGRVAPTQ